MLSSNASSRPAPGDPPPHRRGHGPFRTAGEFLATIPGVSVLVADVIITETGADMARFETSSCLASWAGLSPESNESAGRVESTRTGPGNRYLKGALGIAALSISKTPRTATSGHTTNGSSCAEARSRPSSPTNTPFSPQSGLLAQGECYHDPGSDYSTKKTPPAPKTTPSAASRNSATTSPAPPGRQPDPPYFRTRQRLSFPEALL